MTILAMLAAFALVCAALYRLQARQHPEPTLAARCDWFLFGFTHAVLTMLAAIQLVGLARGHAPSMTMTALTYSCIAVILGLPRKRGRA